MNFDLSNFLSSQLQPQRLTKCCDITETIKFKNKTHQSGNWKVTNSQTRKWCLKKNCCSKTWSPDSSKNTGPEIRLWKLDGEVMWCDVTAVVRVFKRVLFSRFPLTQQKSENLCCWSWYKSQNEGFYLLLTAQKSQNQNLISSWKQGCL